MADDLDCPARCGRAMRGGDIVCRRCWYVTPDSLKDAYHAALTALKASKSGRNIEALMVAKQRIIDSANPRSGS